MECPWSIDVIQQLPIPKHHGIVVTAVSYHAPWYCVVTTSSSTPHHNNNDTTASVSVSSLKEYQISLYYATSPTELVQHRTIVTTTTSPHRPSFQPYHPPPSPATTTADDDHDTTTTNTIWCSCLLNTTTTTTPSSSSSIVSSSSSPPQVALMVSKDTRLCHVYVIVPPSSFSSSSSLSSSSNRRHTILYYKISRDSLLLQQPPPPSIERKDDTILQVSPNAYTYMEEDHNDHDHQNTNTNPSACWIGTSSNHSSYPSNTNTTPYLIIGRTNGTLVQIQPTTVPLTLTLISISSSPPSTTTTPSQASSFFRPFHLFSTNRTTTTDPSQSTFRNHQHQHQNCDDAIVSILSVPQVSSLSDWMISISKYGRIQMWSSSTIPIPTSSSSSSLGYSSESSTVSLSFLLLLDVVLQEYGLPILSPVQVHQAVVAINTHDDDRTVVLHVIVQTQQYQSQYNNNNNNTSNRTTDIEYRLYWVTATLSTTTTTITQPQWTIQSATWLNRFHIDPTQSLFQQVTVQDLCVAQDNVVYLIVQEQTQSSDTTITNGGENHSCRRIHTTNIVLARWNDTDDANNNNNNNDDGTLSSSHSSRIVEIDIPPTIHPMVPSTAVAERTVTYGISVMDTGGSQIRIRLMASSLSHHDLNQNTTITTTMRPTSNSILEHSSSKEMIQTLAVHLRSAFRTYFWNHVGHNGHSNMTRITTTTSDSSMVRLPPSIENASKSDLESTVQLCANQLFITKSLDPVVPMKQGGAYQSNIDLNLFGSSNALDVHVRYIHMLQQTGLYRTLSLYCKWQLMCIGQRISIWLALKSLQQQRQQQQKTNGKMLAWENHWYDQLSNDSSSVERWITNVQNDVLYSNVGDEDTFRSYISWLVLILSSAATYREERAAVLYDVSPNQLPVVPQPDAVPVWTSQPLVQASIQKLVDYWKQNPSTICTSLEDMEYIIQLYLLSCSDTNISCPNQETRISYVLAQQVSYDIMRQIRSNTTLVNDSRDSSSSVDEFIFEISIAHRFFRGICEVAYQHERRRDRNDFALEPLFQRLSIQEDIETEMKFGLYVLKWHADRKYFGHVLKYGKYFPHELNQLMNNDESLKPYRWILSVRQGDYNVATDAFVSISKLPMASFSDVSISMYIAGMASNVVEEEALSPSIRDVAFRRRKIIDKKLELINIQKEMMMENNTSEMAKSHDFTKLWSADRLLDLAIQNAQQRPDINDKVAMLILGLTVCITFENINEMQDNANLFWVNVIVMDMDFWKEHVTGQSDAMFQAMASVVLDTTVFGGLLKEIEGIDAWKDVSYDVLEDEIIERLFDIDPQLMNLGLKRLLSVTNNMSHDSNSDMME